MPTRREFILDTTGGTETPMLADAPRTGEPPSPGQVWDDGAWRDHVPADTWAWRYGGLVSYESAIDAAGYETEAEMTEPGAPRIVRNAEVDDAGTLSWSEPGGPHFVLTADEIYAHFGMEVPDLQARETEEEMEP